MIKVGHVADTHLGVTTYGTPDPMTGIDTRLADYIRTMDWVVSYMITQAVDVVVVAGDAFHVRKPSIPAILGMVGAIKRLLAAGVEVVLYPGNHDRPSTVEEQGVWQLLQDVLPEAHIAIREPETFVFDIRGERLTVSVVPSFGRARILTNDEQKAMTPEEANRAVADATLSAARAAGLEALRVNPSGPRLLSLHCSVDTAKTSTEKTLSLRDEVVLRLSELANFAGMFDGVLLGHIHVPQVLREANPWVAYPGSIERAEFTEADEPKGLFLLQCEAGHLTAEHVETPARAFQRVDVHLVDASPEAIEAAIRQIAEASVTGAIVRVRAYAPEAAAGKLDAGEVQRLLAAAGAHRITGVEIEVERADRVRDHGMTEALSPLAALQRWLEANESDPARRERVLGRFLSIEETITNKGVAV